MASNPDFFDGKNRPVDPSSRAEVEFFRMRTLSVGAGPDDSAVSKDGRIYAISSNFRAVTPATATDIENNVLSYLGPPDRTVQDGSHSYHIWVDGDLRARLTSNIANCSMAPRNLELEIRVWSLRSPPQKKDWYDHWYLWSWGEENKGILLSPLPDQVDGIRLGMEPWQVRALYPELRFWKQNEYEDEAASSHFDITVGFWKGKAWSVTTTTPDRAATAKQSLDALSAKFGEPTVGNGAAWDDGHIRYEAVPGGLYAHPDSPPETILTFLTDVDVEHEVREWQCESKPQKYKPVSLASFF